MSPERKTASLPRPDRSEWKAWGLIAGILLTTSGGGAAVSTSVISAQLDGIKAAVTANATASKANTEAINGLRIAMEERKVTDQRLLGVEGAVKDHEGRIRALERPERGGK